MSILPDFGPFCSPFSGAARTTKIASNVRRESKPGYFTVSFLEPADWPSSVISTS